MTPSASAAKLKRRLIPPTKTDRVLGNLSSFWVSVTVAAEWYRSYVHVVFYVRVSGDVITMSIIVQVSGVCLGLSGPAHSGHRPHRTWVAFQFLNLLNVGNVDRARGRRTAKYP